MSVYDHKNKYGSVDIRKGVPDGLVFLPNNNIESIQLIYRLAAKHRVAYAKAMDGWTGSGRHQNPRIAGLVFEPEGLKVIKQALAERKAEDAAKEAKRKARAKAIGKHIMTDEEVDIANEVLSHAPFDDEYAKHWLENNA